VRHENKYVRPSVNDTTSMVIRQGRHPVIEKQLPVRNLHWPTMFCWIPLNSRSSFLTGPTCRANLPAQASCTYRADAQMGVCPADSADIGLCRQDIYSGGCLGQHIDGESTFMVEMTGTASILNNLSHRSP